ncbi:MAG: hypothetical protein FWH08_03730 [Oscillospiraceae bacterium]|nr:hypothetical protein [Oscillospiraceae bacterium]
MGLYSNTDDKRDIQTFGFLLGRGVLGLNVDVPVNSGDDKDVLRGWGDFGNMML